MKLYPAFNPRFAQGLLRALGVQGDYPSGISTPYQVSINLADLDAEEYAFLRGDRLLEGMNGTLGDATHVPVVRLWNPNSADVIAVVDSIEVISDTAQFIGVFLGGDLVGNAGAATLVARDARLQARNSTWATGASGNVTLPGSLPSTSQRNRQVSVAPNTTYRIDGPWVMTPVNLTGLPASMNLNVFGLTVATSLFVSFKVRERAWTKQER